MKIGLNIGTGDRIARIVVGCVLIGCAYSPFLVGTPAMIAYIVGAIAIFTGVVRFCPAYILFGVNTGASQK